MNKVQAKRLLRLAEHLSEFVEPDSATPGAVGFEMTLVCSSDYAQIDLEEGEWQERHPCGTAACVIGHAGLMPCFQKLGLVTEPAMGVHTGAGNVRFNDIGDIETIGMEFFGLTSDESNTLFLDGFDMTAREKADQIRRIVRVHYRELAKAEGR